MNDLATGMVIAGCIILVSFWLAYRNSKKK